VLDNSYISDFLVTSTLANYQLLTFPIQEREKKKNQQKTSSSEKERDSTHNRMLPAASCRRK